MLCSEGGFTGLLSLFAPAYPLVPRLGFLHLIDMSGFIVHTLNGTEEVSNAVVTIRSSCPGHTLLKSRSRFPIPESCAGLFYDQSCIGNYDAVVEYGSQWPNLSTVDKVKSTEADTRTRVKTPPPPLL